MESVLDQPADQRFPARSGMPLVSQAVARDLGRRNEPIQVPAHCSTKTANSSDAHRWRDKNRSVDGFMYRAPGAKRANPEKAGGDGLGPRTRLPPAGLFAIQESRVANHPYASSGIVERSPIGGRLRIAARRRPGV